MVQHPLPMQPVHDDHLVLAAALPSSLWSRDNSHFGLTNFFPEKLNMVPNCFVYVYHG